MLQKMTLTNFLSFQEKTVFDFTPSRYGILNETNVSSNSVLKGAMFIGPNASGKSNALKGIMFLLAALKGEKEEFIQYWCAFSRKANYQLEYEFLVEGRRFCYSILFNMGKNELGERLTMDGQVLLTRQGSSGELRLGENTIKDDQLDPRTSYLRTASFATGRFSQHPELHALMEFIMNSYYVSGDESSIEKSIKAIHYAEEHGVEKLNQYLQTFQYDFSLEYGNRAKVGESVMDFGDKKVIFARRKSNNFPMPLVVESQGNRVLVGLLLHMIDTIEAPGMLVIDEFGNSLHNVLAEKIVRFFMERADCSQLFMTSHCTNLISNHVFRPDQIDLVTFQGGEGSRVKRISDYKPREAQNLEKMYLSGMFEGLPNYGENV